MNFTRGNKVDRSQVIQKLIAKHELSEEGAHWLTLRLDPYHDFEKPVAGYPDADCYDTVVSVHNYEMNVSKPAGAAANWDAHVFTMPFTSAKFHNGTTDGFFNFAETAETFHLGLVNVAKDDTGGPLFPTADPVASANFSCAQVDAFTAVEAGLSRVIGCAIEIIDTTAQLYKQGALTAYRMPAQKSSSMMLAHLSAATTRQAQVVAEIQNTPPSTVAEAVQYRNTVQWEEKDGAYMALGQVGVENQFESVGTEVIALFDEGKLVANSQALVTELFATTALQAPPMLTAVAGYTQLKKVNVSQSGIFLTGLHNDATFKVRVRVYTERAPGKANADLIPLATPSAPYDYKALALYSHLVTMLPVAVPVSFNAKGDWWRWILDAVKTVAPLLGTAFTPLFPEAKIIGDGAGKLASILPRFQPKKKAEQKKQRRNQPQRNN